MANPIHTFTQGTEGIAIQRNIEVKENKDVGQEKSGVIQHKIGSLRVKERLEIGSRNSDFLREVCIQLKKKKNPGEKKKNGVEESKETEW